MRTGLLASAGIALLIGAAPAFATDTWISGYPQVHGTPLEMAIGENASLHANLDGSGSEEMFWFDEAGPTIAVVQGSDVHTYGTVASDEDKLKYVGMPVASGSGTGPDPWTITATWDAG